MTVTINVHKGVTPHKGDSPHKFHPSILRANDIRGIVGKTLFSKDAYTLGKCFGTAVRDQDGYRVCVGYDGRLSSPDLEAALVEGLTSCGIEVLRVGCGPTPMAYFAEKSLKADAAVMVTGSHNPSEYNGFKMSLKGRALFEEDIQAFGKIAESGLFAKGAGRAQRVLVSDDYIKYMLKDFFAHYAKGKPLKVVWDCGNGAAGEIVEQLVRKLPGQHILLNQTIDGRFPAHHPDPTVPENLKQLIQEVKSKKCDFGVAFDGDGDRIGVVDEDGTIIWGDQLLLLYAEEILETTPNAPIIADVKASQTLFDEVARLGGTPVMWRTGHSLIKSKMRELNSPLAGEMSGHIFFADRYMGFDDSIYAALRLIGRVSISGKTLKDWREELPKAINTPEIRFECPDDRKFQVVEEVGRRIRTSSAKCIDIDGVRVVHKDGWWLLRASNTQSALVARVEAVDEKALERLKADLVQQLAKSGGELSL
ncbi:MAG: phosphomannomutase/phosphoglucomutase [bacterium]|nr:phosphomannomutase/phosphoglucomutase [bacterium]